MAKNQLKICCICGQLFNEYGNDPYPVKEHGQCCNKCNWDKVIPARVNYNKITK